MIDDIECGSKFYFSEEDYVDPQELSTKARRVSRRKVKHEKAPSPVGLGSPGSSTMSQASPSSKKRPRRSATACSNKKYLVPDSDDEMIIDESDKMVYEANCFAKKRKIETELHLWIKHLSALLQAEQLKVIPAVLNCTLWRLTALCM